MTHPLAKATALTLIGIAYCQAATLVNTTTSPIFQRSSGAGSATIGAHNDNNGVTFNVTFTPGNDDLSSTAAIILLEVGGANNGSGLYLLGGEIYFLASTSAQTEVPTTPYPDLEGRKVAVKSGFGSVTGVEHSVAGILDVASQTMTLAVQVNGGSIFSETWNLTGPDITDWSGNSTVRAFSAGNDMGGTNRTVGNDFTENTIISPSGTAILGETLIWNEVATVVIPEPSALLLGGMGGLLLLRRRRGQTADNL